MLTTVESPRASSECLEPGILPSMEAGVSSGTSTTPQETTTLEVFQPSVPKPVLATRWARGAQGVVSNPVQKAVTIATHIAQKKGCQNAPVFRNRHRCRENPVVHAWRFVELTLSFLLRLDFGGSGGSQPATRASSTDPVASTTASSTAPSSPADSQRVDLMVGVQAL